MLVRTIERTGSSDPCRQKADRVAAAVEAAELGFAEWKPGTDQAYMNDRFCDLLGISTEEEFNKATELWVARAQAGIRPTLSGNCCQLQTGEIERARLEYQYDHPRRGLIWLRHSLRRLDGEGGESGWVIVALEDVTERRQALEDVQRLREELRHESAYLRPEAKRLLGPVSILGRGAAIRRTLALAEQVAATDSTVLLLGETGSGKERFGSYIHECSRRRDRLMVCVNCSAIPATLMESELFGREKGAYTGALSKQIGRFELAHGSTLFLDEIAELPLDMQVKLLRVLENRTIERLGSPKPIPVDVRIIAATNRDLLAGVREGWFRGELYYRLNVFPVSIPALRERREDIPLFVQAFVDELAGTMGKRIEEIDSASLDDLLVYPWPGNVRELRNVVERAMILTTGTRLRISAPELDAMPASMTGQAHMERTHILQVLHDTGWRIRGPHGTAARLGLKPTTLESRIKKLGLIRPGSVDGIHPCADSHCNRQS
jgi:formate hydrogenlyase transcriptional activator